MAVIVALPRMVAMDVRSEIVADAPSDIAGYPDMLEVVSISSDKDWSIFGILPQGSFGTQRLSSSDANRTILYVYPKMVRGVSSPAAVVLERSNPWTMETLPYEPKLTEARIVSRRVTEREATSVERERKKHKAETERELRDLGVQLRSKGMILMKSRVTRDLGWEILRREFGVPPMHGKAHWRPAVSKWKKFAEDRLKKDLIEWVTRPENNDWRRGDKLPDGKASAIDELQRFEEIIMTGRIGGM